MRCDANQQPRHPRRRCCCSLSLSLSLSPPPPPLRTSIPSGAWHCPLAHPTVVSQSLPSWRACCRCLRRRPHSKTTCRRLPRLPRMISRRHRMMSWGCRRRQARSTIICPATYIYILGTISTISTTSHALLSSKPPSPHTHTRARAHAVCHARRSAHAYRTLTGACNPVAVPDHRLQAGTATARGGASRSARCAAGRTSARPSRVRSLRRQFGPDPLVSCAPYRLVRAAGYGRLPAPRLPVSPS